MSFYLILIVVSTCLCCCYCFSHDQDIYDSSHGRKVIWFWLSALVVFLSMGLRYGIGTDYFYTYVPQYYKYLSEGKSSGKWEPLFKLLYLGLIKVTSNPQWVFVVTGAIIVGFVWLAILKLSPMPWFSVLLFFISRQYFISLNVVRQYTGLAFVCLGFIFIKEKKYILYIVCAILGTLCHYSTAIFIPVFLLAFIRIRPIIGIALISIFSVFNGAIRDITRWIVSLTPYAKYLDSKYDLADRYQGWTFFEMILVFVLISILLERDRIKENEHIIQFFYNLEMLCVFFSFNLNLVPNSDRISWSLELPSIILIPQVISRCRDKKERWLIIGLICIVYSYVMYYRIFVLNDHETVPYQIIPVISAKIYA